MKSIFKSIFPILLFSLLLSLNSCFSKKSATKKRGFPKKIAVMPIANQSHELSAPMLMRYFLEKRLKRKGFDLIINGNELDTKLYTMGITNGNQVNTSNIQNIGQFLAVEGVVQATIHSIKQDINSSTKIIHAKFRLIEVQSGSVLWNNEVEVEGKVSSNTPVRGTITSEWTTKELRSIAKSPAGNLPDKAVKQALKTLRH